MPASEAGFAQTMIFDYAAGKMYTWYPDDNIACSTSISQGTNNPAQDVNQIVPTYLGTETVDGKLCDKYQYTDQGVTTTSWVWKDKSFPVKEETVSSYGTSTTEYKNIVFAPLSDSLFTIPSSVNMQAYPCFPMPSIPSYP
jgi:outer membrane lipoprotein-sorting protein